MLETCVLVTELDMEEEITNMSPSDHTREDLKIELDGSNYKTIKDQLYIQKVKWNHTLRVLVDTA